MHFVGMSIGVHITNIAACTMKNSDKGCLG